MSEFALKTLASQLAAPGKGLLAMDIWRGREDTPFIGCNCQYGHHLCTFVRYH